MEVKRLKYLDYARGFSMILVMYAHYFTVKESPLRLWIYSFHMPIFFIITGILIYKKKSNLDVKKQFKNLIVPYFVFCFITTIGISLLDIINKEPWLPDFISNIKKTILFYGVKADWFLPCLFIGLIIFHFIKDSLKDRDKIIASLILIFMIPFINIDITSMYTYKIICRSLIATVYIFSGYFLGEYVSKNNIKFYKIFLLFVGTILFTKILGYVDLYDLKLPDPFIYYVSGIIGSLFVLFLFKYLEKKNIKFRLIEFIGKNSIIFLGTHMVIGYFIKQIFRFMLGTNYIVENLYLNGLIILVIVILIEIPLIVLFNKIKRWCSRMEYKNE